MPAYRAIQNPDGSTRFVALTPAEEKAEQDAAKVALRHRIQQKGHDCWAHVVHDVDPESALGDFYTCGLCGDLLQVG